MKTKATTFICDYCGGIADITDRQNVLDMSVCHECYIAHYRTCRSCGTAMWDDDNCSGERDYVLCRTCYEEYYTRCCDCGALLSNDQAHYDDEDYAYCYDCYQNMNEESIHRYSYKPIPVFYGKGDRFFGVELEIDRGGYSHSNADRILSLANRNIEHIYIKSDGSLDEGFEIVTHPMTLDYHMKNMDWIGVANRAIELGYLSHKTSTCGLHVHVNRDSFSKDYEEQERAIGNVLYIIERFWQELLRFSRRTESQLQRWASRYGYKDVPSDVYKHAKDTCGDRYKCINILNRSTIEFRIFRGTLKYNTIIATLQLVDEICKVASSVSEKELSEISWSTFVANIDEGKCSELVQYLKERRLYVNEPIESQEDE